MIALIGAFGALGADGLAAGAPAAESAHGAVLTVKTVRPKLFYAWADLPRSYVLRIVVPPPFALARLSQSVACDGVAMTGGYTQRSRTAPDGLIVVGGHVVGKDNGRQDGGLLAIRSGNPSLRRAAGPRGEPSVDVDQIYSQPILIFIGQLDGRFKGGKANRIALGRYGDGSLFMVMALNADRNGLSAVTLEQFARDVLALAPRKVDWLLNFDGGPSAFLTEHGGRTIAPAAGVLTSYLCAEPRRG